MIRTCGASGVVRLIWSHRLPPGEYLKDSDEIVLIWSRISVFKPGHFIFYKKKIVFEAPRAEGLILMKAILCPLPRAALLAMLVVIGGGKHARAQNDYEIQVYGSDTVAPKTTM